MIALARSQARQFRLDAIDTIGAVRSIPLRIISIHTKIIEALASLRTEKGSSMTQGSIEEKLPLTVTRRTLLGGAFGLVAASGLQAVSAQELLPSSPSAAGWSFTDDKGVTIELPDRPSASWPMSMPRLRCGTSAFGQWRSSAGTQR